MEFFKIFIIIIFFTLVFSCSQSVTTAPDKKILPKPETADSATHSGLHRLTINGVHVYVDIAKTIPARRQGLMYVKSMHEDEGMIFVYPEANERNFWMKNTFIPLSLAYIDKNGEIFQIIDLKPLDESENPSKKPAQYVLEVNQGWFKKHKIKEGALVENLPSPEGADR